MIGVAHFGFGLLGAMPNAQTENSVIPVALAVIAMSLSRSVEAEARNDLLEKPFILR